jgi:DNA-binding NarL/FixJ family response regulator
MPSSKAGVAVRRSARHGNADDVVALIAAPKAREKLAKRLEREKIAFHAFDDVDALLRRRLGTNPSLILLSTHDTDSEPLRYIAPLMRRFAPSPLILACARINRWEVRAALAAGAAGIVLVVDLDSALGPCVRAVLSGQTCVPRAHWQQIEPPPLSSREKQILGLVVMGFMNGQIAEQLFLAESTVKSHLSSAFGKLGVRSRNEAVNLILDPERGLGMGILALGGTPLDSSDEAVRS